MHTRDFNPFVVAQTDKQQHIHSTPPQKNPANIAQFFLFASLPMGWANANAPYLRPDAHRATSYVMVKGLHTPQAKLAKNGLKIEI